MWVEDTVVQKYKQLRVFESWDFRQNSVKLPIYMQIGIKWFHKIISKYMSVKFTHTLSHLLPKISEVWFHRRIESNFYVKLNTTNFVKMIDSVHFSTFWFITLRYVISWFDEKFLKIQMEKGNGDSFFVKLFVPINYCKAICLKILSHMSALLI